MRDVFVYRSNSKAFLESLLEDPIARKEVEEMIDAQGLEQQDGEEEELRRDFEQALPEPTVEYTVSIIGKDAATLSIRLIRSSEEATELDATLRTDFKVDKQIHTTLLNHLTSLETMHHIQIVDDPNSPLLVKLRTNPDDFYRHYRDLYKSTAAKVLF